MINLEDGLTLCGRCIWGLEVGRIIRIGWKTYTIRWDDGETTQLRPDLDHDELPEATSQQQADILLQEHQRKRRDRERMERLLKEFFGHGDYSRALKLFSEAE